jgi:hypothetical protein
MHISTIRTIHNDSLAVLGLIFRNRTLPKSYFFLYKFLSQKIKQFRIMITALISKLSKFNNSWEMIDSSIWKSIGQKHNVFKPHTMFIPVEQTYILYLLSNRF